MLLFIIFYIAECIHLFHIQSLRKKEDIKCGNSINQVLHTNAVVCCAGLSVYLVPVWTIVVLLGCFTLKQTIVMSKIKILPN